MPFPSCGCWEELLRCGGAVVNHPRSPGHLLFVSPALLPTQPLLRQLHSAHPPSAEASGQWLQTKILSSGFFFFFFKQNKKWLYLRQALGSHWFSPTAEAPPPFRAGCMWAAVLGSGAPGQGALRGAQASLLSGKPLQSRHPSSLLTLGLPLLGGGSL